MYSIKVAITTIIITPIASEQVLLNTDLSMLIPKVKYDFYNEETLL